MSIRLVYRNTFDILSSFGNQAWNNKKNSNNNNWVLSSARNSKHTELTIYIIIYFGYRMFLITLFIFVKFSLFVPPKCNSLTLFSNFPPFYFVIQNIMLIFAIRIERIIVNPIHWNAHEIKKRKRMLTDLRSVAQSLKVTENEYQPND